MEKRIKKIIRKLGIEDEEEFIFDTLYSLEAVNKVTIKENEDSFMITNLDQVDVEILKLLNLLGNSKGNGILEVNKTVDELVKYIQCENSTLSTEDIAEIIDMLTKKSVFIIGKEYFGIRNVIPSFKLSISKNGEGSLRISITESILEDIIQNKY